jgi:hypothetical protein
LLIAPEGGEEKKEHDHTSSNQLAEEFAEMSSKHAQKELPAKESTIKL